MKSIWAIAQVYFLVFAIVMYVKGTDDPRYFMIMSFLMAILYRLED